MPAHNHARFLPETIGSVLSQSDPDWELLIMDDNSSDDTWEVVKTYHDPRIRAFHSERTRGAATSTNDLYQRSTGSLIVHLDSDDRYHPEFISRQRAFLADRPDVDISGTYTCEIDADGNLTDKWDLSSWFNHTLDLNDPENWVWQNRLSHGSSVIRRHVFEDIGLLSEDVTTTLDWDFWVRALAAGHRFHVLPEILFQWRVHGSNVTNSDPAETVRCWSVISGRTFHPFLDTIGRADLKAQNVAGFLTNSELANQPFEYAVSILQNVLPVDPAEMAQAVSRVAEETTSLRDAYIQLRESLGAARQKAEQLSSELAQVQRERDALGDRLHGAEIDRRAARRELEVIRSTRIYRAARKIRNGISPR